MTAPDYARLRELAERATAEHDARYLAACDPGAILGLLAERDALLAQVAAVRAEERAAVVEWLRSKRWRRPIPLCQQCRKESAYSKNWTDATDEMREVREAIERGEHLLPPEAP